MADEPIYACRHKGMLLPDHEPYGEIASQICVTAPEQPERSCAGCDTRQKHNRLKWIIAKREPRCRQIECRNAEVTNEGQCQQQDLVNAVLLLDLSVALGAAPIAMAYDAPTDGECKPNEFANGRHELASARRVRHGNPASSLPIGSDFGHCAAAAV